MLEKLPIIGQALKKRDDQRTSAIVEALKPEMSAQAQKLISSDIIGAFFNMPNATLSSEKSISTKLLEANKEWVYRNNDVIAMEVSKIEFELYSIGLANGEIVFNEINSHPLLDLLDKPNDETSKSDAVYIIQSHKKLTGDAFWLKIRNGKQVIALRQLPPDKIELDLDKPTSEDPSIIKGYKYKDRINNEQVEEYYLPQDMIHLKKPNPRNHFRGYGGVEALAETIDVDNLTNATTKSFFKKGAITNFVLSTDQKLNDAQLKRFEAQMKSMYGGGVRNAYKTMILGGGLKPEKLTFSNKDMEFLEQLAWYRDKIMVGFGNTKASLGIVDDVNRASHDSSINAWLGSTVKPDMDAIVNALNEFLVPEFGENLILGYVNPVPDDRTDDIAEATQLFSGRIITKNEARELLDYEAVPDGDGFDSPGGGLFGALPGDNAANPQEPPPNDQPEDEPINTESEDKGMKRRIYGRKKNKALPSGLAHLDVKRILRKRGIYFRQRVNKELVEILKPVARKVVVNAKNGKKAAEPEPVQYQPPPHKRFTSEEIMDYYEKQLHSVKQVEEHFQSALIKYFTFVRDKFLDVLDKEIESKKNLMKFKAKGFFDDQEEELIQQAQIDFTPLLENLSAIAGQRAVDLVGSDNMYIVNEKMRQRIRANVNRFTSSMLETDQAHLASLISGGIENGLSIIEIRNQITEDFDQYSKMQSQRIGRTEVLRSSNQSAIDGWQQSGVVEGKQWITAGADDECADYEGEVVTLSGNFYSGDNEFQDGDPPLHPNCKCTLIPILVDEKAIHPYLTKSNTALKEVIKELEGKLDKRTTEAKKLMSDRAETAVYVRALENHLGIGDGTETEES